MAFGDYHIENEIQVLGRALQYKAREVVNLAQRFAIKHDLFVCGYNAANDTWQLSDGEIYSSARVIEEMAGS